MSVTDNLFKTILAGKEGRNIGWPTGLPKIDKITYGIQKGYLYTVFGDTGCAKTTFTLYSYVYKPLMTALKDNKKIAILFFSFEMNKESLYAKLLSLYLWDNFGIVVSYEEILSLTTVLSDEKFAYISESKSWLETIEEYITIIDTPITPQQCSVVMRMFNERFGKFIKADNDQESYIPNDRNLMKIVITDHVKLTKDNGKGPKSTIDELANEYIDFRNKCGITGIFVQQANRNSKGMDRRLNGYNMLQLDD